jgi:type II secretory ATPase GspE/PulE/Tfp pilus assembly ATPase PilB-like protein
LEKLQKWAAAGNLMPTHRVRHAESSEWVIAAYVPGLENTVAAPAIEGSEEEVQEKQATFRRSLGKWSRAIGRGKVAPGGPVGPGMKPPAAPPDVIKLCDELMEIAFARNASDIHIDPEENIMLVQLRVDGVLEPLKKLPKDYHPAVIGRFKVLSRMDIAERRAPQDGRFSYALGPDKRKVDIRAACLPTTHGERMTLRLLAVETEQLRLNCLGMSNEDLKTFAEATSLRQGMILLTGPTGSGKSTTLYAALRHRLAHHPGRFITIEDPVEFDVVGVAQVEVDTADKVGFASALRNVLRSDPDVIMIGEIRDFESADIAIKAALTGHLVFSSLHTNSAAGVITRLVDMGIQPYLVAATIRLCVAQRLVRRLCVDCRQPRALTTAEAQAISRPAVAGATIYEPGGRGCETCHERGYRGRVGLFELLRIEPDLATMIVDGCDEGSIVRYQKERQLPRLMDDAVRKLLAGETSLAELMSVSTV